MTSSTVHPNASLSDFTHSNFNIYFVDINKFHRLYEDIIAVLSGGLIDLGFGCTVRKNLYASDSINIFLGSTIFAARYLKLTERFKDRPYIIYQLEQLDDQHGLLNEWPEYAELLKNARMIWDYAPSSARYLQQKGFSNVYYMPPGFHRNIESFRPRQNQDIDVLFYGSTHQRRTHIMKELNRLGVNVVNLASKFGAERNRYIARAKIILNIHAWDDLNVLETIRLSFLLANRSFVISENSDHNPYEDSVIFAPYDQLVNTCLYYLQQPQQLRDEIAQKGYLSIRKQEMASILKSFFDRIDEAKLSGLCSPPGKTIDPYYAQHRQDIVNLVPRAARRILDIGCSGGIVGVDIKNRQDCHVTGIEMQAEAAQHAAKLLDLVICGNAFDILPSFADLLFDCIIMADVVILANVNTDSGRT